MTQPVGHQVSASEFQTIQTNVALLRQIAGNTRSFSNRGNTPATATTSSSASFSDIPGTNVLFNKTADAATTNIRVRIGIDVFSTVASTTFEIGVQINSVDYAIFFALINPASQHGSYSHVADIGGIAAGVYNPVKIRLRRISGTGIITIDASSNITYTIEETLIA